MENRISKILVVFLSAFGLLFAVTSANAQFCTFTKQDVECSGEATGIITLNPSGGTAPYDYEWSHNSTINSNEVTNLPASVYTITISDAIGDSEVCLIEIIEPGPITILNVIEVDPMCGLNDGSFEINAVPQTGGSASDLMYSIDGGATFQTSNIFTGLGPNDYLIIVADINGCFIVDSRQLVDATSVVIDLESAMCDPGGTITVDITPSGGTTPYDYLWSNGFIVEDLTGVDPGTYSVTVTDREGCAAIGEYTVAECCDASMFCDATITDVSCAGAADGAINVSPIGGTAPYVYSWSHDATLTTNVATNLAIAFYNITITDAQGCETMCGFDVVGGSAIVIDGIIETNPTCGNMDGSLTINTTPSSVQYSIDGGTTFQASNTFTGLGAGTYSVVVSDGATCTTTQVANLIDAGGVTVNLIDSFCESGSDISLTVMGSGGVGPYTYTWTGTIGFSNPSPNVLTGPQGTYTVVVTDVNGCTAEATYTQDNCCDSGMFCTSSVTDVTCNGGTNGSITVTPNGGTGPFTYVWSHDGANTTSNAVDLLAGFYSVTITDDAGCSAVCGIDVAEPVAIVIDDFVATNPACGADDGEIVINVTPKSGSGTCPLEYSIDGGMTFQGTNQFGSLGSGDYLIIVRDCDDCMAFESTQLFAGSGLNISFTTDCQNGLVDIDITTTGGTGPYTYSWTGPAGFTATSEDINGGATGVYEVMVTDADGCMGTLMVTQNMCCQLEATCPPDATDIACGSFPDIPAEFLNADADGGNDAAIFTAMGGVISAFPGPCGDVTITASDVISGAGCQADPFVLIRTFVLTDGITTVDCEMTMTGGDLTLPMMDVEATDIVLDCPEDIDQAFNDWFATNGGATATDDCGDVSWTTDWVVGTTIDFETTYTVTFTATDDCGNFVSTIGSFTANSCPQGGDITGFVWEDLDGNGVQDGGEQGLEEVPVSLINENGVLVSIQFTNTVGEYTFPEVPEGVYTIHFGVSIDYEFTLPNVGSDGSDSDVDEANGSGTTSFINHTMADRAVDAGVYQCVPVGELVWFDANQNDQFDAAENGIDGMEVRVWKQGLSNGYYQYDYTNTGPKPDTPSDDGYYKFCLPPGTYYLEFMIPPFGLVPVLPGVGGSANDSDITNANGPNTTASFTILSGEEKCDLSAGYYPMATIGNNIFFDENSNGLADPSETGMANVMVELYDADSGSMIESQTTDAQGSYLFDYLGKDDYYIKVVPPTNYFVTVANVGTDENMDSDVDNSNGPNTTAMYTLTPGMELNNVDIGLVEGIVVAVDWINVAAENRGDYNQLDWTVAFQHNTSHFAIERRTEEEIGFSPIAEVDAINSISLQDYNYQDFDIKGLSLAYYRIAEYDINGNVSYSKIVVVNSNATRAASVNLAPNPFISQLTIEIDTPINAEARISFWNSSGTKVEVEGFKQGQLSVGMNSLSYDWNSLPPGVYSAQIAINGQQFIKKLIKIE